MRFLAQTLVSHSVSPPQYSWISILFYRSQECCFYSVGSLSPFLHRKRLQGYAQKDDLKLSSQGRDIYPLIRVPGPMRDVSKFHLGTQVPRLAPNTVPVPYRGLLSLAQESYQLPNHQQRTWDRFCPVERPPTVSYKVPVLEIMHVPGMYETEYKCYGSGKPMPV